MKKLCCLLLILFSLTAAAAEPVSRHTPLPQGGKPPPQTQTKQKPPPSRKLDKTEKSPKKSPKVKPFIPSEKIGADEVVAFPVDI